MTPTPKPFEFHADVRQTATLEQLTEKVRQAEAIGYHGLVVPDHLIDQMSPVPVMAAVAAVSDRVRIGAFVLNNDLRHPAVVAQDLASLDVLSGGRLDVCIGAGWNKPEYDAIGIPFDAVPIRQERLEEAVTVLKGCLRGRPFSFAGKHYRITDYAGRPRTVQKPHPPFMIGGGGRRTLELAAREAEIVGLAPRIRGGRSELASLTWEGTAEKIEWVRAAAGRRFRRLTFNVYPSTVPVTITQRPKAAARRAADMLEQQSGTRLTEEQVLAAPQLFIGSTESLTEKFLALREGLGISSIMVGALGPLDGVVERLAGS
jgi:probable F420-dependent oxidoreductase